MSQFPTRRALLAGGAAIATARFPILGANDRIKVGIVGLGGRGRDHINYYSTLKEECRITAICDVNQAARERAVAMIRRSGQADPKEYLDMRQMFESKDVDAVSIPLPNHWHALATIWACQAGKDVYVEKPACHNVWEGEQMIKAARKYNRMVQVGSQSRSIPHKMKAIQLLKNGVIGEVYHARGLCFRRRFSIGHTPDEPVPPGIDWDKFLGPAQMKPYSKNKYAYNWHWFWDTGNGDIGNQGVHEMDICLWGLKQTGWPLSISSTGGKFIWEDDQETPNTQQCSFLFADAQVTFDVRNLPTPPEGLRGIRGSSYVGNIFFGSQGFLIVDGGGFQVWKSTAGNVRGEGAGTGNAEKYEKVMEEAAERGQETVPHIQNFFEAIRKRDYRILHADVEIGVRAADFCHLANIAYRVNRMLRTDGKAPRFLGDEQANALLTRNYRPPYVVPREV
jgi:predicted dehydrogenase